MGISKDDKGYFATFGFWTIKSINYLGGNFSYPSSIFFQPQMANTSHQNYLIMRVERKITLLRKFQLLSSINLSQHAF